MISLGPSTCSFAIAVNSSLDMLRAGGGSGFVLLALFYHAGLGGKGISKTRCGSGP